MHRLALAAFAVALTACSSAAPSAPNDSAPVHVEAGFLEVPPRSVVVRGEAVSIDATAKLFYNFQPAKNDPRHAPIFVAFNGFSAEVVRAFGTGATTVADGGEVVSNPTALTDLGNVLWVDPRQAGFSYDVIPSRPPAPSDCAGEVFNEYVDAADVLYAVLEFLDHHPSLEGNIDWLGESYGGVRIQWAVAYARGRFDLAGYEDPALETALSKHDRARLTHGMILLEAWLAGVAHGNAIRAACDDPATTQKVEMETGASCGNANACDCAKMLGRSTYNYGYAVERQKRREYEASLAHTMPERAAALLGVRLDSIEGLKAEARGRGFKCAPPDDETPPDTDLQALLGALPAGQHYYVPYSPLMPGKEQTFGYSDWSVANVLGPAFVDNLADVPAMATNGERDLVVPFAALQPALQTLGFDASFAAGKLRVATAAGDRFIVVTDYADAGHMITMIEPAAFHDDIAAWLKP